MADTPNIISVPSTTDGGGFGFGSGGGLLTGLLLSTLFRNSWGAGWGGGPAGGPVANEIVLTPTLNAIQNQISTLANQVSQNQTNDELESIENQMNTNNLATQQGIANNARDYLQGTGQISTAIANGNFVTLQSINGLSSAIVAALNQGQLQSLNSFNNLTTTTLQGFNQQNLQLLNSFSQVIAGQNAQSAQMAACCCDLKGAIGASTQAIKDDNAITRALINDINMQNLRDRLQAAETKVSNNDQNQYLLSTILTHLHPVVS